MSDGDTRDITHWFGEGSYISTGKSIMEPSGYFSLNLLDRPVDDSSSIYALIHPMDGIEIRAAYDGSDDLTTIMRGFVSNVSREEAIGEEGDPVRRVYIAGEDVGKVWLTQYLYFLPNARDQKDVLRRYGFMGKYFDSTAKNMSGAEFVERIGGVLAQHVAELVADTKMNLTLEFAAEGEGTLSPLLLNGSTDISFYQFMSSMLDAGAFYELWIDDPGDAPALIRWRDLWSGPAGEIITADEINAIQCRRDDSRTSNWYFATPRGGTLNHQTNSRIEAQRAGGVCDGRDDRWSQAKHFGWRKMEVEFALMPPDFPANSDQPTKEQYQAGVPSMTEWIIKRTQQLRDLNKENAHLESCTLTCRGNELIRPGTWITVEKGEEDFEYYAVKVEHHISFFGSFKTVVNGARGERISGDDTYRSELDLKGALR